MSEAAVQAPPKLPPSRGHTVTWSRGWGRLPEGVVDAEGIEILLSHCGWTHMRLPNSGYRTGMFAGRGLDYLEDFHTAYGYTEVTMTRHGPTTVEIELADMVSRYPGLISDSHRVLRRIVALRMMWNDDRARYTHTWASIAREVRASPTAVRTWHAQGILEIGTGLKHKGLWLTRMLLLIPALSG